MLKISELCDSFLDGEKDEMKNIIENLNFCLPNNTYDNNINIHLDLLFQDSPQNPNGFYLSKSDISFKNENNESNKKIFDDSKELENKNNKSLLAFLLEEGNYESGGSIFDDDDSEVKDGAFNFDGFITEKSFFNKSDPLNLGLNAEDNKNIIENLKKAESKENGVESKNIINNYKKRNQIILLVV